MSELKKRYPEAWPAWSCPPASEETADGAAELRRRRRGEEERRGAGRVGRSGEPPLSKSDLMPIHLWRSVLKDDRTKLISTGSQETFMIWLKASFLGRRDSVQPVRLLFLVVVRGGGALSARKTVRAFLSAVQRGLVPAGGRHGVLLRVSAGAEFLLQLQPTISASTELRISEWLSFRAADALGFGISFQLPLVMLFLERIGIFTVETYLAKWRIAVLVLAILSMVLSPGGDPTSMLLMFVPLVGLYFAGIALCKWLPPRRGCPNVSLELRFTRDRASQRMAARVALPPRQRRARVGIEDEASEPATRGALVRSLPGHARRCGCECNRPAAGQRSCHRRFRPFCRYGRL